MDALSYVGTSVPWSLRKTSEEGRLASQSREARAADRKTASAGFRCASPTLLGVVFHVNVNRILEISQRGVSGELRARASAGDTAWI